MGPIETRKCLVSNRGILSKLTSRSCGSLWWRLSGAKWDRGIFPYGRDLPGLGKDVAVSWRANSRLPVNQRISFLII